MKYASLLTWEESYAPCRWSLVSQSTSCSFMWLTWPCNMGLFWWMVIWTRFILMTPWWWGNPTNQKSHCGKRSRLNPVKGRSYSCLVDHLLGRHFKMAMSGCREVVPTTRVLQVGDASCGIPCLKIQQQTWQVCLEVQGFSIGSSECSGEPEGSIDPDLYLFLT